ncbi:MAG TPA: hypothetical protein VEH50_04540 [Methylomirabilota bacterium]|nr:hypothetical protein [Methylomirabilota bacterium]
MEKEEELLANAYRTIKGKSRVVGVAFYVVTGSTLFAAMFFAARLLHEGLSLSKGFDYYTALGELFLVIVLSVGEFIAFQELRHIADEGALKSFLELQKLWTDKSFVELRGKMYKRLDTPSAAWSDDERRAGVEMCRRMDEFAHQSAFWGSEKVFVFWDMVIAKAWDVLEEFVREERNDVDEKHKWLAFSVLGNKALRKVESEGRYKRKTAAL